MKRGTFFRIAAVVSSLVLVGGFVAYSAGALDGLIGRAFPTAPQPAGPTPPGAYMGGSKFGIIASPSHAAPPEMSESTTPGAEVTPP